MPCGKWAWSAWASERIWLLAFFPSKREREYALCLVLKERERDKGKGREWRRVLAMLERGAPYRNLILTQNRWRI